jgi:hypothetical protein
MATNAKSENAKSRMVASSVEKHECGGQRKMSQVLGAFGLLISSCYGPFLLGVCFETYEPFISLILKSFFQAAVNHRY